MTRRRAAACVLGILTLLISQAPLAICSAADGQQPASDAAKQTKIKIEKPITRITHPLRPDGYPDYIAAIDQHVRIGVTPEDNAAVLLAEALGPGFLAENVRKRTFEQLEMVELPASGNYFVSQVEMIKRWRMEHPNESQKSDDDLFQQFDDAQSRPWADAEFPLVAQWLAVNEKTLELICRAAERSKFYFPGVDEKNENLLLFLTLPMTQQAHGVAELLTAHAMKRLQENDIDGAWHDLMCCHRLGRLVAQGSVLIDLLVGFAIDGMAVKADVVLAHAGRLSAPQALKMEAELRELPAMPAAANVLDTAERCMFLDVVAHIARDGHWSAFQKILDKTKFAGNSKGTAKQPEQSLENVDWNIVMQVGNEKYDRLVAIARMADPRQRRKAMQEFDSEMKNLAREVKLSGVTIANSPSKEDAGHAFAKVCIASFFPGLSAITGAEDRSNVQEAMDQTAFALAVYRADKGQYPDSLDALVPACIASIPDDPFAPTPTPIRYRREGDAYKMWSVHRNGIDDDGRSFDDTPPGDDWVIGPVKKSK